MKKHIIFKALVGCSLLLPTTALFSCSQPETNVRKIDGSDWSGVVSGIFGPNDYLINLKTSSITYYNASFIKAVDLVIPDYVEYNNQKLRVLLGSGCFSHNFNIQGSVELNEFITDIPSECFYGDIFITKIIFHNYPTAFQNLAFKDCQSLGSILVKNVSSSTDEWTLKVKYIGAEAFKNCNILQVTEMIFSESLLFIGQSAFQNCYLIGNLRLRFCTHLTSISAYAFANCLAVRQVYLPASITSIGEGAFSWCEGLQEIFLPNSNMHLSLGNNAFYHCPYFRRFSLPFVIDEMGVGCFYEAARIDFQPWHSEYKLEKIPESAFQFSGYIEINFGAGDAPDIKNYAFANCASLACIDLSGYKTADEIPSWSGINIFYGCPQSGKIRIASGSNIQAKIHDLFVYPDGTMRQGITIGAGYWEIEVA